LQSKKIDVINGTQDFNKLIVDGKSLLDEFEESLEDIYKCEMDSIYYYMEEVANCRSLPVSKFRELKKEYINFSKKINENKSRPFKK
jgi:hypothetical protein